MRLGLEKLFLICNSIGREPLLLQIRIGGWWNETVNSPVITIPLIEVS
jgi:hypothetical protein